MKPRSAPRRWLHRAVALAAGLLILLAVLVGIARLLLPLVPAYQDEIRRFVAEATGIRVEFSGVSAAWPLAGPEVQFIDVRAYTAGDGRPVLDAGELRVGINLLDVLLGRRLVPGRLELRDAALAIERTRDDVLVNGVPLGHLFRNRAEGRPPERLAVGMRDVSLTLVDRSRMEPRARLYIEDLLLRLKGAEASIAARLLPEDGLGRRLELNASLPFGLRSGLPKSGDGWAIPPREWQFGLTAADLDVARVFRLFLDDTGPLSEARGDLRLSARFHGDEPRALQAELELGGVVPAGATGLDHTYSRLKMAAEWAGVPGRWTARLRELAWERSASLPQAAAPATLERDEAGTRLRSERIPAGELWPLARAFAGTTFRRQVLPTALHGDVRELDFEMREAGSAEQDPWRLSARLENLGIELPDGGFAVRGVSGRLEARARAGQLRLDSGQGMVRLPEFFRDELPFRSARGTLSWEAGDEGLDVYGHGLRIITADGEADGQLRLIVPPDAPPFVDVAARISLASAPAAVRYLPLRKFPEGAVDWLDRAVVAGSVPAAELLWQGPVRGIPYDKTDGRFRVEFEVADAVIDYAPGWPRAEALNGQVVVDRVSLASTRNDGMVGGLALEDVELRIPSFTGGAVVELADSGQIGLGELLGFMRRSPVADALGPAIATVRAAGRARASLGITVPVERPEDWQLAGRLDLERATLGLRDSELELRELEGEVKVENTRLAAPALAGRFLDEPVRITFRPAAAEEEDALSHVATLSGATPVEKLTAAFSLPWRDRLLGAVEWEAQALFPHRDGGDPLTLRVQSQLEGLLSTLPPPLTKGVGEADPMELEVRFPEPDTLEIDGRLARGLAFRLQLEDSPAGRWILSRGSAAGGPVAGEEPARMPVLPEEPGLVLTGRFPEMRFEDWVGREVDTVEATAEPSPEWRIIDIAVGRFSIFGRLFPDTRIDARRGTDEWRVRVDGPRAAGRLVVPDRPEQPLAAALDRLWLLETDPAVGEGRSDPRRLPGMEVQVGDFRLNDMRFGALEADASRGPDGLQVESFRTEAADFATEGEARWTVQDGDVAQQRTMLRATLTATDIAGSLEALGYDPVVEGRSARVTAGLSWPGGPSADFLNSAAGEVTVIMEDGQFLPVEPGGGRLLGLLSIQALPRRLGMDFRDVVDEGLAFDAVKGQFSLEGGNAFTCNLGLEGPAAELGIVGRVGIRDRDYEQVAVVRPNVSEVLALGGAVVGGPVVGGAVLLISQIFRKPLQSLGETYYQVEGSWSAPEVRRVQRGDIDISPFRDCERYLATVLTDGAAPPMDDQEQEAGEGRQEAEQ